MRVGSQWGVRAARQLEYDRIGSFIIDVVTPDVKELLILPDRLSDVLIYLKAIQDCETHPQLRIVIAPCYLLPRETAHALRQIVAGMVNAEVVVLPYA